MCFPTVTSTCFAENAVDFCLDLLRLICGKIIQNPTKQYKFTIQARKAEIGIGIGMSK